MLATMQEMFRLHDAGRLEPPAEWYFRQTKPVEELYDTEADPFEIENLSSRPEYREVLERMRAAHAAWVAETGDLGGVPEEELAERYWPGGVQPRTPSAAIEPAGGSFDGSVRVSIRSDVAGASIAYTFEEGDDAHWKLYTDPIMVSESGLLRTRAIRYGWAESQDTIAEFDIAF
jgi:hypothetical protein